MDIPEQNNAPKSDGKPEKKPEKPAEKPESSEDAKKLAPQGPKVTTFSERSYRVFIRPLVSEKTAHMGADNTYAFAVHRSTNKVEIKKAFSEMYKVNPISVRIVNMPRKFKQYGKTAGVRSAWKKAIVRAPKGSKIDVFEGV